MVGSAGRIDEGVWVDFWPTSCGSSERVPEQSWRLQESSRSYPAGPVVAATLIGHRRTHRVDLRVGPSRVESSRAQQPAR